MTGPNNPSAPAAFDAGAVLFALQAVQFGASTCERKSSMLIWERSGSQTDLDAAVLFLMTLMKTFNDAIDQYKTGTPATVPKNGNPPKCGPGFHEEFGICVPDN